MRTKLAFATLVVALLAGCTAYPPSARYGMYNGAYRGGGVNISGYGAGSPSYQRYGGSSGYSHGGYGYQNNGHGPKYGTMTYSSPGVTKSQYAVCQGAPEVQSTKAYMFMGVLLFVNTTKVDHGCEHYTHVHSETPTIIYRKSLP